MSQDNIIKVRLMKEKKNDILLFVFEKPISINFVKSDNNDIKEVFKEILNQLSVRKFRFELEIDQSYSVELYKEVASTYIDELNSEIEELLETDEWKEVYG